MNDGEALERVEAEVAFQGEGLRELNAALSAQQLELLELKTQMKHLLDQVRSLRRDLAQGGGGSADAQELPPHY